MFICMAVDGTLDFVLFAAAVPSTYSFAVARDGHLVASGFYCSGSIKCNLYMNMFYPSGQVLHLTKRISRWSRGYPLAQDGHLAGRVSSQARFLTGG